MSVPTVTYIRPSEVVRWYRDFARQDITLINVRVLAHRHHWRRMKRGHNVYYHLDDIHDTAFPRAAGDHT